MLSDRFHVIVASSTNPPFEFVERKGIGHPDTLADELAEDLSRHYSQYTLQHFGVILHHNFDKIGIMGGTARVGFGGGILTSPIRVLINGRASFTFGSEAIPVAQLLRDVCRSFFAQRFPMIDIEKDLRLLFEVSAGSSPGGIIDHADGAENVRSHWFTPRTLADLPEHKSLFCNDTSLGCAFAPYTPLEALVLGLELYLNSVDYKTNHPWAGSDVKIMAKRHLNTVALTVAFPQIASYVPSLQHYKDHIEQVCEDILIYCQAHSPYSITLTINARDNYEQAELYLTATGSSIETGDEGVVGRGNRVGGLITPLRPYSMEGVCGKNPVYHTGKLYSVAAYEIATRISNELGIGASVYLVGQCGQPLYKPWQIEIALNTDTTKRDIVRAIADATLSQLPHCTEKLLQGGYRLC